MIDKLKMTPLGGVGEIGALNCMVYETDDEAIVVDCGSMFPNQDTLGVDLIIPDFTYLKEIQSKLKALVLTHGHEDHIGAVPFLLQDINLPIYCTPFPMGLIKAKLEEFNLHKRAKLIPFKPGDTLKIGSFEIETVYINHSTIESCALAIKTHMGFVVHLSDFKIDVTPLDGKKIDLKKFAAIGKKGVLALFSDSTNATEPGMTLSEKQVLSQIRKICSKHDGRIIITLFASNILRIQGLVHLAKKLNRHLSFVGRSLKENTESARLIGSLSLDDVLLIDVEETRSLPPNKVMVLVTGTQGEPQSILTRMASDSFKPFRIREGDLVLFSSKMIPGNEKNIAQVINNLCRQKAQVLYESIHEIHTSGHAHQDELKQLTHLLKPKYFIPIHGEYRHLVKHAELALKWGIKKENIFVTENGHSLIVEKTKIRQEGLVPSGRVFVDGSGVGEVADIVLRDRRHLADTGLVLCILSIDRTNGEILRGPELISRGFIEEENQDIFNEAKKAVLNLLEGFNMETRTDLAEVQEEVRLCLRRFFMRELSRKPVVIPVIQEM